MSALKYLAGVAALTLCTPGLATTFYTEDFICPVGGEKFSSDVIGSMTSWGQRPDGRRYGTTPIIPMTECPGNGFLYFQEKFSKTDVEALTPLINGGRYQAMRKTDTPRYRAWWLMNELGNGPYDTSFLLLAASWEADENPEQKARYQRQFIETAGKLAWSEANRDDWFWFNLRAANALRELGEFEKSTALIATLDDPSKLPKEPDQVAGAKLLIDGLRQLNAEKNNTREPANLIPDMEAGNRCVMGTALSPIETAACEKPEVRKASERVREYNKRTAQ